MDRETAHNVFLYVASLPCLLMTQLLLMTDTQQRCVQCRLTAYKLAVRGSNMPCAAGSLSLGPDNVHFRKRLRQAHPETEEAMRKQREACVEARSQCCLFFNHCINKRRPTGSHCLAAQQARTAAWFLLTNALHCSPKHGGQAAWLIASLC